MRPRQFPIRPAARRPGFSAEVRIPRTQPGAGAARDPYGAVADAVVTILDSNHFSWDGFPGDAFPNADTAAYIEDIERLTSITITLNALGQNELGQTIAVDVVVFNVAGAVTWGVSFTPDGLGTAVTGASVNLCGNAMSLNFHPDGTGYQSGTYTVTASLNGQALGSVECIVTTV